MDYTTRQTHFKVMRSKVKVTFAYDGGTVEIVVNVERSS